MSKPNPRKQQKQAQRKDKIKNLQHQKSASERIDNLLYDAEYALDQNEFESAARYCRTILNSHPNHIRTLSLYVHILVKQDNHEFAVPVLETLKKLEPEVAHWHFNHVASLYNVGRYTEAAETGANVLKESFMPRELKKELVLMIETCKKRAFFSEPVPKHQSKTKPLPSEKPNPQPSEAIKQPEQLLFNDLQKVDVQRIVSKTAPLSTSSLPNTVSPDPQALFWLGYLLFEEHQRMQSEFEELLCVNHTCSVTHFGYQTETVRKVLKIFHGRVLLSDEVGLGKTIEAAMVLKEYLLRGMVKDVLILCPPSLIEQWGNELLTKFNIKAHLQRGPISTKLAKTFWKHNIIVASLHTAKNSTNIKIVTEKPWDMVIVDEAHHLRNKKTLSWKLVDSIQKKFLLLLSATPVQNNLVELYNLITLLKPGIFPPEKEFLDTYCESKNHRKPKNADALRMLLRDVMIRNTRAGCGVRFPKRFASTYKVEFTPDENIIYSSITAIAHRCTQIDAPVLRLSIKLLLERAGAHLPLALSSLRSLSLLLRNGKVSKDITICEEIAQDSDKCLQNITNLTGLTAKTKKLISLIKEGNKPTLVFCRQTAAVDNICTALLNANISYVSFHGSIPLQERIESVERFRRGEALVMVSSESGGEGHNLQFCNSLINFDLPWNPMQIEQRIGRIHRIGQENDVFIFNLCYADTIEEQILEILETKIRMFELVIGEVDSILGNLDEQGGFSEVVLDLWVKSGDKQTRNKAFEDLGSQLINNRDTYLETCRLDEELFGREIEA